MKIRTLIFGFVVYLLFTCICGCGAAVDPEKQQDNVARTQVQAEVSEEQRPMIWVRPNYPQAENTCKL